MSNWTKGPWYAADRGDYTDYDGNSRVVIGDDRRVAVCQHHGSAEDEANARLIAAAPELVDALNHALIALNDHANIYPATIAKVKAALAKAGA